MNTGPTSTGGNTYAMGRRERKRWETRNRLYEAAMRLFREKGYDATTMDDIAELADTARATAFNHFPKKREFLDEWARWRRELVATDLDAGEYQEQPIDVLLRRYLDDLARINLEQRDLTHALLPAWVRAGGPIEGTPALAETLAEYIELGQRRGEIRSDCDAAQAGVVLRSAYLGVVYQWVREESEGRPFDLVWAIGESIDVILRGLLSEKR